MTREAIHDSLRKLVEDEMGKAYGHLDDSTRFREDLDLDSMDLVSLITQIEDRFGITIQSDEIENLTTVGRIVAFIESQVQDEKAQAA